MNRSTPHSRIVAMAEGDASRVERAFQHGLELARRGAFFEAHEAFETAWRACPTDERDFFQGLVHVVVSAYQRDRGRDVAADRQRVKALRRLAAYEPAHRGIDVAALRAALERAEADPREHLVERHPQPPVAVEEEQQPERDEHGA
jgi:predicted metal-dependent hydrolase